MDVRLPTPDIDTTALVDYRLARVRSQLVGHGVDLAVLTSPISLRYAVDHTEYQLFQSHIPAGVLVVPAEGPVTMYGASHGDRPHVDDYRPPLRLNGFDAGVEDDELGLRSRTAIDDLVKELGLSADAVIAVERLHTAALLGLVDSTYRIVDADPLVERAKAIKSDVEMACIRHSVDVAQLAVTTMRDALRPGMTENEVWAHLHMVNVANGGSWTEGKMLASGHRTNPWLREATDKIIEAGELVAFDTDMVGPYGYCADISRTLLCGDQPATPAQRDLYRRAVEEIEHNIGLVRPGVTFAELSQRAFVPDPEFIAHRYPCLAHGVGLSDEYPQIKYRQDWDRAGYDGVIEQGMVLCIESFTGSDRGGEGVKLEQMVHVTASGTELLSTDPWDPVLYR